MELWLINKTNEEKCILLLRLAKTNEDSNIICSSISKNGNYLAFSDSFSINIFKFNLEENSIKKIKTIKDHSARFLFFSSDEKKLIIVNQAKSLISSYDICKEIFFNVNFSIEKFDQIIACDYLNLNNLNEGNNLMEMENNDNSMENNSSSNKKKLSAKKNSTGKKNFSENLASNNNLNSKEFLCFSTINKKIFFVNLDEKNSFVNENMPTFENIVTQIKFKKNNQILLACEDNRFFILDYKISADFDGEYNKLVDINFSFDNWTTKNLNNFPENYLKWYNKFFGIAIDNNNNNNTPKVLLYTDYNYINISLDKNIPKASKIQRINAEKNRNSDWTKKIKDYHSQIFELYYKKNSDKNLDLKETENYEDLADEDLEDNFKIVSRFSSILYMEFLKNYENEGKSLLIVVENDWNKITKQFRDTVLVNNYGH